MKRLIKKSKRTITAASYSMTLHSFIANTGYPIELSVRILNNKLQYSIIMITQYSACSFYDGPSFNDAFDFYIDIVIALKNLVEAEKLKRNERDILARANSFLMQEANHKLIERNHLYYKKPLFLGTNDPC